MSVAVLVVASKQLLPLVVQFQDGVYFEVRPLLPHIYANNFDLFPFHSSSIGCHGAVPSDGNLDVELTAFDVVFSPFFVQHGLHGVDRLLVCVPRLRSVLLAHASRLGLVDVLRRYCPEHCTYFQRATLMEQAATFGHLAAVEFLIANGHPLCLLDVPAAQGHLDIVQRLHHTEEVFCTPKAMDMAAKCGHLSVVTFLHIHRAEGCTVAALDEAAKAGHDQIVRFLLANRNEGCSQTLIDDVATAGHFAVLRILHDAGMVCTASAMDRAAGNGHLEIVRFLHDHRQEGCTTSAMDMAAENGFLEVVQFLHTSRREGCTTYAMDRAAKNGFLEVVQFLHTNRSEGCTTDAVDWAARNNRCDVVLYLCANRLEGFTQRAVADAHTMRHVTMGAVLATHHQSLNRPTTQRISWV
ncbi:hypothetical protein DYB37_007818 [Aphanomyces astaci]|uniref:Uncharacterized protein n=1 Tax=Aphanomyces astaci TaxID=112090 RepID=A0A3R7BF19_APHAT|nr:hypothetical protein DYB37_007818 [Aphanomyces astaci]